MQQIVTALPKRRAESHLTHYHHARRQRRGRQGTAFRYTGPNTNFIKRLTFDVPDALQSYFPDQGVRLAVHYPTGFYRGFFPAMVSVYLVPRNGSNVERRQIET